MITGNMLHIKKAPHYISIITTRKTKKIYYLHPILLCLGYFHVNEFTVWIVH
jgi:hypothetical protein